MAWWAIWAIRATARRSPTGLATRGAARSTIARWSCCFDPLSRRPSRKRLTSNPRMGNRREQGTESDPRRRDDRRILRRAKGRGGDETRLFLRRWAVGALLFQGSEPQE